MKYEFDKGSSMIPEGLEWMKNKNILEKIGEGNQKKKKKTKTALKV